LQQARQKMPDIRGTMAERLGKPKNPRPRCFGQALGRRLSFS